jgi:hypothetical protein
MAGPGLQRPALFAALVCGAQQVGRRPSARIAFMGRCNMENTPSTGYRYGEMEEHEEGPVARSIEQQTAKVPSDVFLWAALAAMGVSFSMQLAHRKADSLFIGQWPSTFLLLGIYNKIVKVAGSDRVH